MPRSIAAALGDDFQRERLAVLHKPFAGNAPALLKPTRCGVLRPFFVNGERQEPGTVLLLCRGTTPIACERWVVELL